MRVYVYYASGLTPRSQGSPPQPFLKVFNGTQPENIRTTRDVNVGSTLEPEFYAAFELTAVLPGQSRLHVEVWDYQVLQETQARTASIDHAHLHQPRPPPLFLASRSHPALSPRATCYPPHRPTVPSICHLRLT